MCGQEFVGYGGQTTCLEVRDSQNNLTIIDAGTGIQKLGNHLMKEAPIKATLLFTHAHWDHVVGFPFFQPVHEKSTELDVICCAFTHEFVSNMLGRTMDAPYFPLPISKLAASINYPPVCQNDFQVDRMRVSSIPLSHPNGGVGYKFVENGRSFVLLTDNEPAFTHGSGGPVEDYIAFAEGTDLLIHDAEYTPEEYRTVAGYGHSTYLFALDLAVKARAKRLALFHHNRDRSDAEIDAMVADCRQRVEEMGAMVEVFAMAAGMSLDV